MDFQCKHCGAKATVPDEWTGRKVRCKGCNGVSRVRLPGSVLIRASGPSAPADPVFEQPQGNSVLRPHWPPTLRIRRVASKWSWRPFAAVGAVALFFAVACAIGLGGRKPAGKTDQLAAAKELAVLAPDRDAELERIKAQGLKFVEDRVRDSLKAPKTAEFNPSPNAQLRVNKDGYGLIVKSWVDAKNEFGVPLRGKFDSLVEFNEKDGGWSFVYLIFNDDLLEASPAFRNLMRTLNPWTVSKTRRGFGNESFGVSIAKAPWKCRFRCDSGRGLVDVATSSGMAPVPQTDPTEAAEREFDAAGAVTFWVHAENAGWTVEVLEKSN